MGAPKTYWFPSQNPTILDLGVPSISSALDSQQPQLRRGLARDVSQKSHLELQGCPLPGTLDDFDDYPLEI